MNVVSNYNLFSITSCVLEIKMNEHKTYSNFMLKHNLVSLWYHPQFGFLHGVLIDMLRMNKHYCYSKLFVPRVMSLQQKSITLLHFWPEKWWLLHWLVLNLTVVQIMHFFHLFDIFDRKYRGKFLLKMNISMKKAWISVVYSMLLAEFAIWSMWNRVLSRFLDHLPHQTLV